ncbi:hypothetical protein KR51_00031920 [Rubidibacter lacunae KORDI 51-2]|uniref:Nickel transport protein n=1 Tax=Rubidibacter lacunae KORDI 51-2 TaxID=582515 RepID=U5DKK9_9CHRO|nr:carboxypeptidase-like regulatory domain-containing protein [Rubidibacter lacunae]ERN40250.1 hypothetical protein KR51_00031920 [Rubidibacter lacunae KORDI 51-2]
MRWHLLPLLAAPVIGIAASTTIVRAHGSAIDYRRAEAIELRATFDSGEPMAGAQVTVYAPYRPTEPWLKGTTDAGGRFTFLPDPKRAGSWDVKVRLAGHGTIVSIPGAEEDEVTTLAQTEWSSHSGYTPLQTAVMAAAGIWGCVGTALFFSRDRQPGNRPPSKRSERKRD